MSVSRSVLHLVGARPQLVKAAPVSRALRGRHEERLVHSGQHWDEALSGAFFTELGLPEPDVHLGAEGLAPGPRISHIVAGLRGELRRSRPAVVLVHGDTDTTLAGALAARAERVPLAHVEAGLRSGVASMPEEINRVATDHVSDLLLCPTERAAATLRSERAAGRVVVVGDVMLDALLATDDAAGREEARALAGDANDYLVATIHRAASTDDPERLRALLSALEALGRRVVLPCHPRTRARLDALSPRPALARVRLVEPVGHAVMLALVRGSRGVLTDSGGLQKEAWFLGVPCVTLRDETEWTETLAGGWNVLAGADADVIADAVDRLDSERPERDLDLFGSGHAAERVVAALDSL